MTFTQKYLLVCFIQQTAYRRIQMITLLQYTISAEKARVRSLRIAIV